MARNTAHAISVRRRRDVWCAVWPRCWVRAECQILTEETAGRLAGTGSGPGGGGTLVGLLRWAAPPWMGPDEAAAIRRSPLGEDVIPVVADLHPKIAEPVPQSPEAADDPRLPPGRCTVWRWPWSVGRVFLIKIGIAVPCRRRSRWAGAVGLFGGSRAALVQRQITLPLARFSTAPRRV